jgi:hypothetical protein
VTLTPSQTSSISQAASIDFARQTVPNIESKFCDLMIDDDDDDDEIGGTLSTKSTILATRTTARQTILAII